MKQATFIKIRNRLGLLFVLNFILLIATRNRWHPIEFSLTDPLGIAATINAILLFIMVVVLWQFPLLEVIFYKKVMLIPARYIYDRDIEQINRLSYKTKLFLTISFSLSSVALVVAAFLLGRNY